MLRSGIKKAINALSHASGLLYCLFILTVWHFNHHYVVTDIATHTVLFILYFVYSALFLYGIIRSNGHIMNLICGLILPFLMLFLADHPILLIPTIGVIVSYFLTKRWREAHIAIAITQASIYGLLLLMSLTFGQLSTETVLARTTSPDGRYILEAIARNEGALGGSVRVTAEEVFSANDLLSFYKQGSIELYRGKWDEQPVISWLDDHTVSIDGRKYFVK